MTVEDLIKILENLPQNKQVGIYYDGDVRSSIDGIINSIADGVILCAEFETFSKKSWGYPESSIVYREKDNDK